MLISLYSQAKGASPLNGRRPINAVNSNYSQTQPSTTINSRRQDLSQTTTCEKRDSVLPALALKRKFSRSKDTSQIFNHEKESQRTDLPIRNLTDKLVSKSELGVKKSETPRKKRQIMFASKLDKTKPSNKFLDGPYGERPNFKAILSTGSSKIEGANLKQFSRLIREQQRQARKSGLKNSNESSPR